MKVSPYFRYWKPLSICSTLLSAFGCAPVPRPNPTSQPSPVASTMVEAHSENGGGLVTFLIPDGYRGLVLAIYDQAEGVRPVVHGDSSVYEIPEGGVLRIAVSQDPGRRVRTVFKGNPAQTLRPFPTCAAMRLLYTAADRVGTCWLREIGASNAPAHEAFIVTRWQDIPAHYNRAMPLLDSLVFGGHFRGGLKWVEPPDLQPVPPRKTT